MKPSFGKYFLLGVAVMLAALAVQGMSGLSSRKNLELEGVPATAAVIPKIAIFAESKPMVENKLENAAAKTWKQNQKIITSFLRVAVSEPPAIGAKAVFVGDAESGQTYFEIEPFLRWPLASLTKLMAAVKIKDGRMQEIVTLFPEDFNPFDARLSGVLSPGGTYNGEDLFKVMLVASANEAAAAFAREYGYEEFIEAMNNRAADWGLVNTFFRDPAGLSSANQSTAADIFTLTRRVYEEYPDIFNITRAKSAKALDINTGISENVEATHAFAGRADFLGGKTGSTPDASNNLITIVSYGGRPLVIIILGSDDRFGETQKLIDWFKHDFTPSR